jgi:hypothetical protein
MTWPDYICLLTVPSESSGHLNKLTNLEINGRVVTGNEALDFRSGEEVEPLEGHHRPETVTERGNLCNMRINIFPRQNGWNDDYLFVFF